MSNRTKPRALVEPTDHERDLTHRNQKLTDELATCRSAMNDARGQLANATKSLDDQARTIADQGPRLSQQLQTITSQRASIEQLKAIIADLEMQLAHSQGYARALNERLEHDSPVVEVPQVVTTTKAALARRAEMPYERPATTRRLDAIRDQFGRETSPGKHWTAI